MTIASAVRSAAFGVLGAALAALPVSILKTYAYFVGACRPLHLAAPILLSWCGVVYYPTGRHPEALAAYALGILLAGALCGILATAAALRWSTRRGKDPLFWPPFWAAVLFDFLFVFVLLYPGQ